MRGCIELYDFFLCLFSVGVRTSAITLPQDPDANTKHRKKRLAKAQDVYDWNFSVRRNGTYVY